VSARSPAELRAHRLQGRLEGMKRYPPSARQVALLKALREGGTLPWSMQEASERIDAALQGQRDGK
jgi:hypothetical protein